MLCSLSVKIKKWLYDWSFRYELVRLYGSFQVDRRVHTANWKISDLNKFIWCHWCVILINILSIDRQNDKYNKDYALESGTGLGGEGWRKKNSVDYNFFCTHYILNKYFKPKGTIKKHPPSVWFFLVRHDLKKTFYLSTVSQVVWSQKKVSLLSCHL